MIDRTARDRLSRNLKRLISGKISNDQFENSTPDAGGDPGIIALADMAWLLYSEMKEHRLVGRYSIEPSTRREVLRWIMFLDSDIEYRWRRISLPGLSPARRVRPLPTRLFSFNTVSRERAAEFLAAGDHDAWPFISRSEYKLALKHPRWLAGAPRMDWMQ